jgi:hypothetical protein
MDDTVQAELRRLYDSGVDLTPGNVLAQAEDPRSPLHEHFTWDDTEAAQRYRLSQATNLIVRCRITQLVSPTRTVSVRAFSHDGTTRTYRPTEVVLNGPGRDDLFARALRDVEAVKRRFADLVDFDAVLRAASGEAA